MEFISYKHNIIRIKHSNTYERSKTCREALASASLNTRYIGNEVTVGSALPECDTQIVTVSAIASGRSIVLK